MAINKVRILPEELTNKIAAGEVVDRPASIAKELIENSIDAGCDEITIILKHGGRTLLQIVDNGTGMSREDAILAVQRHTTSKISNFDDLHNIRTLGFRGEALASIASICRMEVKTVFKDAASGTQLIIDGGVVEDVSDIGGVRGTSISVKNVFYNTPVRKKFLKSDEAEYRQILNIFQRFALGYFDITFKLYHNDQLIYDLKPSTPEIRLVDVLGKRYKENFVKVEDKGTLLQIWGYIGKKDTAKKTRGDQYLYLNGRYIVNRALNHAILSSYGSIIPRGEFPLYAIFLDIEPRRIDVNVHPSKMEVKFADERLIYSLVHSAIKRALSSAQIIPALSTAHKIFPSDIHSQSSNAMAQQTAIPLYESEFLPARAPGIEIRQPLSPTKPETPEVTAQPYKKYERQNVWQIHNQYIVSEIRSGLIIIDQHVAHERILYEKTLKEFETSKPASQQLLFPHLVELSPEEYSYLKEILPFLERVGFVIKGFGGNTVVIEGVPSGMKIYKPETILNEIIDEFKQNKSNSIDVRDNLAKCYSCKMAIKKGEPLTLDEMNNLIDQLFATQSPYFCPHGRPVIINVTLEELDKRFSRI